MSHTELEQIALLAEVDDVVRRTRSWSEAAPNWGPALKQRQILDRVLTCVDRLRIRLEAPLVVATFGGTGTGKSTLVNALVGAEVSRAGRQRPTTTRPVLLIHPATDADSLGLRLEEFEVRRVEADVLREIVLVDCPDPDTSEAAEAASNLAILRRTLPQADVLLYVSTQQKYRSARVLEELKGHAGGCRLIFVQTHADLDEDIREDWRRHLSDGWNVPEMFFVDSRAAMDDIVNGRSPGGDFRALQQTLTEQLGQSQRGGVRRANLIELLGESLKLAEANYDAERGAVDALRQELEQQQARLKQKLTDQLRDELQGNSRLWERRLLTEVVDVWGFSPFSSVLRLYNGLGGLIASFSFFRARTSAQMALVGAVQSARWVKDKLREQEADSSLDRLASFGLSDQELQNARLVLDGYVRSAQIQLPGSSVLSDLSRLRDQAASVEGAFLGDARQRVDEMISRLAKQRSGMGRRLIYEVLWAAYVVFILYRIGENFFWSTFLRPTMTGEEAAPLLTVDFYIPAAIFLLIWSGILVGIFSWRIRRGLAERIRGVAESLAAGHLRETLFPALNNACSAIEDHRHSLRELSHRVGECRKRIAVPGRLLGGRAVSDSPTSGIGESPEP